MSLEDPADALQATEPSSLAAEAIGLRGTPGQDWLRTATLAWLQAIPLIGGTLAELVSAGVPAARERRLQDLVERIAADVDAIWDAVDVDLADETFAETLETAIEQAMRASEDEKREAFAAIIVNSLTEARPNEEERLFFQDVMARSRTLHVRVLKILAASTEFPRSFSAGAPDFLLLPGLPEYDRRLVELAWAELSQWRLANASWGVGANKTGPPQGEYITDLGRRFLRFVTVPKGTELKRTGSPEETAAT